MKQFLLVVLALAVANAQLGPNPQQFQAQIVISKDPNVNGALGGTLFYDYTDQIQRINYNVGPSQIIDFAQRLEYLFCSGTCDSSTLNEPQPIFFHETTDTAASSITVTGRGTCTGWNKASPPSTGTQTVWVDTNGIACRVVFVNGKQIDFTGPTSIPAGNTFTQFQQWNCPQQQCNKEIDFMLVFDESGSIDSASWVSIKNFGAQIASAYTFGPNNIAMGLVTFSTTARLILGLTVSQQTFLNTVNNIQQAGGYTCLTCGMQYGYNEFIAHGRPNIAKVIIFMTDGKGNRDTVDFGTTVTNVHNHGVIVFAIGVAGYDINEIRFIASSIPGVQTVFTTPSYAQLGSILDSLIIATCIDIPGNPCGSGCLGFCSCGATCICPDICNDNNECTTDSCTAGQGGNGCTYTPKVCNDGNLCTTDTCSQSVTGGCVFTNISCNDNSLCTDDYCIPSAGCQSIPKICNDNNVCTADSCNPTSGCVFTPLPPAQCDSCQTVHCSNVPCSTVRCINGTCNAQPISCNDNNACSTDSCNTATGSCQYTPVNCDDNNACTHDLCDPITGCFHQAVNATFECNDNNVCTDDVCVPASGCANNNVTCVDTDPCTDNECNSVLGCQYPPTDCSSLLSTTVDQQKRACYAALCSKDRNGCYVDQIPGTKIDACQVCNGDGKSCVLGLSTGAVVGISAGLLAVIIIASVIVCAALGIFGGKKGYDVWLNHRQNMQSAHGNPLYTDHGLAGKNPLYAEKQ